MLEPVQNRNHISSVQITLAESFGVEDRGHFYDPVGALQDVVVNHLMQVVAMAAMEAPVGADAATLKDAKFNTLRSAAGGPFTRQDAVEESWRIMAPLLRDPPPAHRYAPASWGPGEADRLLAGAGGWRAPWVAS